MAFEQGVYTDVHDLANRIRLFSTANSWIQDEYVVGSGTGSSSELYLHKGNIYVSIEFLIDPAALKYYHNVQQTIEEPKANIYGNTGYNVANDVNTQPGNHIADTGNLTQTPWIIGPCVQYYFFTNVTGDYIHVVIETVPNEYVYLMFGELVKQGTYTGGAYVECSRWEHFDNISDWDDDSHHAPFDANTWDAESIFGHVRTGLEGQTWQRIQEIDPPYNIITGDTRYRAPGSFVYFGTTYGAVPPMSTVNLYHLSETTGVATALGYVPDIRNISVETIEPGSSINLGADTWLIFPLARKGDPLVDDTITMNSGHAALALKKIV